MRVSLIVAMVLSCAAAQAGVVVGNDQSGTATIWDVDPATGIATALYSSSTSAAKPRGMAYDASTNTLYWNNGSTLCSSPYQNSLVPTNLGGMTYNAATINFVGLGFKDGKLYGTRNIATEAVYSIDPVTRVATLVYTYPSTFDFGGLDFDDMNGKLYGLSDTAPSGSSKGLYEIDYSGGSTAFKAPYPGSETDIDGLAMHNGVAYYVTDGPVSAQPYIYMYKVDDGSLIGTLPSPFTGSGTFSAAAWVPEPASLALVALAALALRRR